jgi:ubiquinone/menaquinone biosynthesis C-methylase UbiE
MREVAGARTLPREPEPDLVMNNDEHVQAYSEAGRIDGAMSAAYLFHSGHATEVLQGCAQVIDLGCGPATQLVQIAQFNPDISFHGIDLSAQMLERAEAYAREKNVSNVRFSHGDITQLDAVESASVDGVISMLALHHLPTIGHLRACFREIARILKPGGALYLADFGRLKSLKSVLFFAYMNAAHQPHVFSLDYERSLRAAFLFDELKSIGNEELPADVDTYATFIAPLLTVMQTRPKKPIPECLKRHLIQLRRALPRRYRADLDDLRSFFRLGGMPSDPFRR